MATIDYKQKIKDYMNSSEVDTLYKSMLNNLFPELKESEDERIRKALINGFNKLDKSAVWYNGITNGQILAWLEKQGKSNMGISEATKQELENNLNKALEKETPESCNEFLDEQKPADLPNGEDYGIDGLYAAVDILQKTLGEVDGYQTDDGILEHKCAINAVKELSKQKPAETEKGAKGNERENPNSAWSEEDEARFESCIKVLQTSDGYDTINAKWFNSLKDRVQPQQQEWSEEDASLCTKIQEILSVCRCYNLLFPDLYKKMYDWLKSLKERYTWKPSDLPHWKKSNLPNNTTTGFNSDYFCHKGYCINYEELFEKLPKDD